jgi:hypothetical protein
MTSSPATMPVERGKIREFARATKSDHPDHMGARDAVSPPTFLTTLNFWSGADSSPVARLGLDLKRILHGSQEYTFPGEPPRAGTELTATTRVDAVYEKEGKRGGTMTFVETVTEFRDPSGEVVAEARSTVIETGKPPTEV